MSAIIGTLKVERELTIQASFSELEYAAKKKMPLRDRFLGKIEALTPWTALEAEIEQLCPKGTGRGQPPIGVEWMLRMYIAQHCFGLADEGPPAFSIGGVAISGEAIQRAEVSTECGGSFAMLLVPLREYLGQLNVRRALDGCEATPAPAS